jgi:hypothetical protein
MPLAKNGRVFNANVWKMAIENFVHQEKKNDLYDDE